MSSKHSKLENISKKILSDIIHDVMREEESAFGLITVTRCEISSDKSYLDVFVSSFLNTEMLPKALAKHGYFIQKRANEAIDIRRVPKIRFRYDESGEQSSKLTSVINEVTKGLNEN